MRALSSVIIILMLCSTSYVTTGQPFPFLGGGIIGGGIGPFGGFYPGYYSGYPGYYGGGFGGGYGRPYGFRGYRYPHFHPPIAVLAG